MADIKPGDEVRIFFRRSHQPDPEGGKPGTVTKVGRKWATATYEYVTTDYRHETRTAEIEFAIATGYQRGDTYGNWTRVLTPQQVINEARKNELLSSLRKAGVELTPWRASHITLAQIEALAEVTKTWQED